MSLEPADVGLSTNHPRILTHTHPDHPTILELHGDVTEFAPEKKIQTLHLLLKDVVYLESCRISLNQPQPAKHSKTSQNHRFV